MTRRRYFGGAGAAGWLLAASLLAPSPAFTLGADDLPWPSRQSLPPQVYRQFARHPDAGRFVFSAHLNPFYLHGDFDGDRRIDIAIWIREKSSQKAGIAILHNGPGTVHILGAGRADFADGGDFSGKDAWYVFHKRAVSRGADGRKPPVLRGDAIYLQKTETSSGLLYWNGRRYAWYPQGD